uniref:Uncharacterized protein n=1 Tax=Candidatus Kentrum sp. FW TaxID=2126338 RepID=A0A450TJS4_9GAMM|nr:MAG: hypothetical protein BECKFW1821B_GA0114236_11338 [Candidatus Kentron sp. FW]
MGGSWITVPVIGVLPSLVLGPGIPCRDDVRVVATSHVIPAGNAGTQCQGRQHTHAGTQYQGWQRQVQPEITHRTISLNHGKNRPTHRGQ